MPSCVFRFFMGRYSSGSSPKAGCLCSYIIFTRPFLPDRWRQFVKWKGGRGLTRETSTTIGQDRSTLSQPLACLDVQKVVDKGPFMYNDAETGVLRASLVHALPGPCRTD